MSSHYFDSDTHKVDVQITIWLDNEVQTYSFKNAAVTMTTLHREDKTLFDIQSTDVFEASAPIPKVEEDESLRGGLLALIKKYNLAEMTTLNRNALASFIENMLVDLTHLTRNDKLMKGLM